MIQSTTWAPRAAAVRAACAAILALAAGSAVASADVGREGPQDGAPLSVPAPAMPPPLASGPIPDLELLFTAQVAGWIEPCG